MYWLTPHFTAFSETQSSDLGMTTGFLSRIFSDHAASCPVCLEEMNRTDAVRMLSWHLLQIKGLNWRVPVLWRRMSAWLQCRIMIAFKCSTTVQKLTFNKESLVRLVEIGFRCIHRFENIKHQSHSLNNFRSKLQILVPPWNKIEEIYGDFLRIA